MKKSSHRAARHGNKPLVAAATTIGSTLGIMVAKVKGAGELALGGGRKTARVASKVGRRIPTRVKAKLGVRQKARRSKR